MTVMFAELSIVANLREAALQEGIQAADQNAVQNAIQNAIQNAWEPA